MQIYLLPCPGIDEHSPCNSIIINVRIFLFVYSTFFLSSFRVVSHSEPQTYMLLYFLFQGGFLQLGSPDIHHACTAVRSHYIKIKLTSAHIILKKLNHASRENKCSVVTPVDITVFELASSQLLWYEG